MRNIKHQAEFEAKFDFFYRNHKNKALLAWVIEYLYKKGILFNQNPTIIDVKSTLFNIFKDHDEIVISEFYRKMEKAWEAHNRRLASQTKMLNVNISKEHKKKFLDMAKLAKLTNIQMLEFLIDDNYKLLINFKNEERKGKEADKAKKIDVKKHQALTNARLNTLLMLEKNYNNGLKTQNAELKDKLNTVKANSSILFAMIEKAVKNRSKLAADHLIQATKAHTLIDIVQAPLDEPEIKPEIEKNAAQPQTSNTGFRTRGRPIKTVAQ